MLYLLTILAFGFPLVAYLWKLKQDKLAHQRKLDQIQRRLKEKER